MFVHLMNYHHLLNVSMDDARQFLHIGYAVGAAKQKSDAYETTFIRLTHGTNGGFYKKIIPHGNINLICKKMLLV